LDIFDPDGQGDQIGRIFASWVVAYIRQFCITEEALYKICINYLKKHRLGYILGDFFYKLIW
jgi:hypothetical protein